MVNVTIVVRETGRTKPDYSLRFALPGLPRVGDYISIHRPDKPPPFGEDLVVRHIWWQLEHPETHGFVAGGQEKTGKVNDIVIECDPAIGPYSSKSWRSLIEGARANGISPEEFDVSRFVIPEMEG